jgi:hypothetical protein
MAALVFGVTSSASAATATCPDQGIFNDGDPAPGQDTGDTRQFVVTTNVGTISCYAEGPGNIQPGDFPNLLDVDEGVNNDSVLFYSSGGDAGNYTIAASVWSTWSSVLLSFKSGGAGETPVWSVFLLSGGVTSGTYDINDTNSDQGLSHAILWGVSGTPPPPPPVIPEPASLLLLGSGLTIAGAKLRRHLKKKV